MTRALPRTNFHSSKLIRCLADLTIVDAVEPGNAFAEKLGLWIHFADAIKLSAVHNDNIANLPKTQAEAQSGARVAVGMDRAILSRSFSAFRIDCSTIVMVESYPTARGKPSAGWDPAGKGVGVSWRGPIHSGRHSLSAGRMPGIECFAWPPDAEGFRWENRAAATVSTWNRFLRAERDSPAEG